MTSRLLVYHAPQPAGAQPGSHLDSTQEALEYDALDVGVRQRQHVVQAPAEQHGSRGGVGPVTDGWLLCEQQDIKQQKIKQ